MTEQDCQCKRCGSSIAWETCDHCVDGFDGHECGEDCCSCAEPEDNRVCQICDGEGGHGICLSTPEWCWAHPRPGMADVPRNTVEWFEIGGAA